MKVGLSSALQDQIAGQAIAAYPRECCGLIEGVRKGDSIQALALHAARNLAASADRFELDPHDHIAAQKAARASGHALIGCYHSHPDGKAAPSITDQEGAAEQDFLWLIAATNGSQCRMAGFVYRGTRFDEVVLSAVGADLVTSSLKERS